MKVEHLIAALLQVPSGTKVFYEGEHKDEWVELRKVEYTMVWGVKGVYLK